MNKKDSNLQEELSKSYKNFVDLVMKGLIK
jgi:ClpP class serine protease